jgi:hypothetical protein
MADDIQPTVEPLPPPWHQRPLPKSQVIGLVEVFLYFATGLNMPWWFTSLILLLMWALLVVVAVRSEWTVNRPWLEKVGLCTLAGGLVWALGSKTVIQQYRQVYPLESLKPDVTLRFVNPTEPVLQLVNQSGVTARDIKYMVVLWNLDLPNRTDPLPIPVAGFDWIGPHSTGGPQGLFDLPTVSSLLKSGNRLIGSAGISCPDCARGYTFIVFIIWGKGGWFTEVRDRTDGHALVPRYFSKPEILKYAATLQSIVPQNERDQIGDPQ